MCKIVFEKKEFEGNTIGMELELREVKWENNERNRLSENDVIGKMYIKNEEKSTVYITADTGTTSAGKTEYTIELVTIPVEISKAEEIQSIRKVIEAICRLIVLFGRKKPDFFDEEYIRFLNEKKDIIVHEANEQGTLIEIEIKKNEETTTYILHLYKKATVKDIDASVNSLGYGVHLSFGIPLLEMDLFLNAHQPVWWSTEEMNYPESLEGCAEETKKRIDLAYKFYTCYYTFAKKEGVKVRMNEESNSELESEDKGKWGIIPRMPIKMIIDGLLEGTEVTSETLMGVVETTIREPINEGIKNSKGIAHSNISGFTVDGKKGIVMEVRAPIAQMVEKYLDSYINIS